MLRAPAAKCLTKPVDGWMDGWGGLDAGSLSCDLDYSSDHTCPCTDFEFVSNAFVVCIYIIEEQVRASNELIHSGGVDLSDVKLQFLRRPFFA
jgi:hypothetical protein